MNSHIMPTYGRQSVTFSKGEGAWLWDTHNNRYLDALSGIAVCNLGHAHPAIHQAICDQSRKLLHTSNLYHIELQERLADKLTRLSGMDNIFFCNSGAEANEAALKIARLYGHRQGIETPTVLTMEKSFHGRTLATLSATGNTRVQQGFSPLLPGFVHIPYNDIASAEQVLVKRSDVVAILLEPVQGEGGVNIPGSDYLNKIRMLCDRHNLLMMVDEIQTGVGRTGKFLAFQHHPVVPDVCTMAKALGNGVPIGACLARGNAAQLMTAGSHGSTFGGNPLACSAALAVIETLEQEKLAEQAESKGQHICSLITRKTSGNTHISHIRNLGLMIGIDLDTNCTELVGKALKKGLLINVTAEKTIRLLPPLIIDDKQIELLTDIMSQLLNDDQ